ncbi:putative membrane protein [Candidatus Phytoplasma solani]|uniref:hypothetical protein n=1 Tax=Candidatus Phytoplasma solani TaxID=69896 RepID=UPI0032DB7D22
MKMQIKEKILKIIIISILPLVQTYLIAYFRVQYVDHKIQRKAIKAKIAAQIKVIEDKEKMVEDLIDLTDNNKEYINYIIKIFNEVENSKNNLKTVRQELQQGNTNVTKSHIKYLIVAFTIPFIVFLGNFLIEKFSKSVLITLIKKKNILKGNGNYYDFFFYLVWF